MRELSGAEWHVLESLWADSPKVGSQIVADMEARKGWSRSTTLTMLRRMADKGLIFCDDGGKMKSYVPLVGREEAVRRETESFLDRVYQGSVSMLLNGFVKKQKLSAEEIMELRQILDKAEGKSESDGSKG
ncbi:MAG: BlaI/MecI/CopY family transcriptional regulator [Lachnospiraceae bacterium]|nr:BlaI/MecI/CopY family transcriptional regulator [Lachnospiraceae bacterium]